MQNFLQRFMPFLMIGMAVVVVIIGIFFLSYVLIWGVLIALVLYLVTWVSEKFKKNGQGKGSHKGRVIEHEK